METHIKDYVSTNSMADTSPNYIWDALKAVFREIYIYKATFLKKKMIRWFLKFCIK